MPKLEDYVRNVIQSCASDNSYLVNLNWKNLEETIKIVKGRAKVVREVGSVLTLAEFKGTSISVYNDGRLLIKRLDKKVDVNDFLKDLFGVD
ncbi:MAG: hypothetical protein J7L47_10120 [Candidatus Odinarchaeota archaeon]|nr:hypothetical protein [Candidatus Odinarchaeota archaeon]